jgi:hypothetical protein
MKPLTLLYGQNHILSSLHVDWNGPDLCMYIYIYIYIYTYIYIYMYIYLYIIRKIKYVLCIIYTNQSSHIIQIKVQSYYRNGRINTVYFSRNSAIRIHTNTYHVRNMAGLTDCQRIRHLCQ